MKTIEVYTDGSCHTKLKIGAWAALILEHDSELDISGIKMDTTNNQMELMAVIKALDYIEQNNFIYDTIVIYTDSQYVEGVERRIPKFKKSNFKTKKGEPIRNLDLVKILIHYIEKINIEFIKVKAHQRVTDVKNHNRTVDMMCRKLVRNYIKDNNIQ